LCLPWSGVESDVGIIRKLENTHEELKSLKEQAKAEGFFNNVKNADKLGGLVEGIRDAVMDYQVRNGSNSLPSCLTSVSDIVTARYLSQELSTHCKPHFLTAQAPVMTRK
jgi:hypothetical protein